MEKNRFIVFLMASAILLCLGSQWSEGAEDAGTDGAAFMKVALGARQAGMGEAFTGLADDAYALAYNPAGLVYLNRLEFSAMRNSWLDDTNQNYLVGAKSFGKWALAFGTTYFDEGTIDERDRLGAKTGSSLSSYDVMPTLGLAYRLSRKFSLGLATRMIYSNLADETSMSFSADLGFMVNFDDYFRIGVAAQNLGNKIKFDSQKDNQPMIFRGGIGWPIMSRHSQPAYRSDLVLTADAVYKMDNDPNFNLGAEYLFANTVALRGGYKINTDIEGLIFGTGIKLDQSKKSGYELQIDYAFAPVETIEENTHRVGLTLRFGGKEEKTKGADIKPVVKPPASQPISGSRDRVDKVPKAEDIARSDEGLELVDEGKLGPNEEKRLRIRINFDFDKSDIRTDMEPRLRKVGEFLRLYSNRMIRLEGHTDAIGTDEYNIGLSHRRATAVMEWLIKYEKIDRSTFYKPVGYGETRAIAPNTTAEGRFNNRRTVVIVYNPDLTPTNVDGTELKDIKISTEGNMAMIELEFNGLVTPKAPESLPNPERLVIDFPGIASSFGTKKFPAGISTLKRVRVAHHREGNFTRVVLDLTEPSDFSMTPSPNSTIKIKVGR